MGYIYHVTYKLSANFVDRCIFCSMPAATLVIFCCWGDITYTYKQRRKCTRSSYKHNFKTRTIMTLNKVTFFIVSSNVSIFAISLGAIYKSFFESYLMQQKSLLRYVLVLLHYFCSMWPLRIPIEILVFLVFRYSCLISVVLSLGERVLWCIRSISEVFIFLSQWHVFGF